MTVLNYSAKTTIRLDQESEYYESYTTTEPSNQNDRETNVVKTLL